MSSPATRNAMVRLCLGCLAVAGFTAASVGLYVRGTAAPVATKVEPQQLFTKWPAAPRKPELVIVLTGQMHGYLQKCGCSNPQKGGLERRYNFIESLKAKGWEVIGLDVGDLPRPLPYSPTPEQTLAKYEYGMKALQLMGFKAIALGKEEMSLPTLNALAKYSIQKGNEYPKVLAANVANRDAFPNAANRPAIGEDEIITANSGLKVGVLGLVGGEVVNRNPDNAVNFGQAGAAVQGVLAKWGKGTDVNVMLYQGPLDWKGPDGRQADAQSAAKNFPQFHIILCKTPDDSDAPLDPTKVNGGATMICQVGQRGQTVGVIGVYRGEKGIELYYERVVMSDEFETPDGQIKNNKMIQLLQEYSDTVKDNDFLSEMAKRKRQHPIQAQKAGQGATYVGDSQCVDCHKAETQVYAQTKHAHAYDALVNIAKNPTGRNFDGECIICHTVGYEYQTGYVNAKVTPNLKNVQCESCHGPASLHVAEETANLKKRPNQQVHAAGLMLSPWKAGGKGTLPSLDKLDAYAKEPDHARKEALLTKPEYETFLRVYQACAKCHDIDNDPHFKLEEYWKKIAHTGLKKK